jgi:transcriptional regulator with XRE-family HTH domain
VKPVEREKARKLRREEGCSVKEIAALLSVSPSSVSRWTADIVLSPEFVDALRLRASRGGLIASRAKSASKRSARLLDQQRGRELARHPTRLHLAGCMLYWAEGAKDRNAVKLTNSDPDLIALFVRFLRRCHDVAPKRIALSVNCHLNNGLELSAIESWWLQRLELPQCSLRKATVNSPSQASRWRRNILVSGTARVTVYSTAIVQSIYGAIQEYAGIERPEWVDGRLPCVAPP